MALYQFMCGSIVMIILLCRGCSSQLPVCGRASFNTRIVGGQDADPGVWPWMASLNFNDDPVCAGSLITNQWVLTAAHCLLGEYLKNTTVFLGRNSQSGPNFHEVSRGLERIVSHPGYDSLTIDNDIGLLKLSAPVTFTDYIQPVCLASADSTFHTGVRSWVAGFGANETHSSTSVLQEVNLPVVGNNECECTYSYLTENMMCAGLRAGGKDACQRDSGGALVTKKGSMWIQSGIVSFGDGCGDVMTPGVYTRVSQYQEWISSTIGSSTPGFVTYTSSGVDSDLNFDCSNPRFDAIATSTTTTATTATIATTATTTNTETTTMPNTTASTASTATPTNTETTTMPNTNATDATDATIATPTNTETTTMPNTHATDATDATIATTATPTNTETTTMPNTNATDATDATIATPTNTETTTMPNTHATDATDATIATTATPTNTETTTMPNTNATDATDATIATPTNTETTTMPNTHATDATDATIATTATTATPTNTETTTMPNTATTPTGRDSLFDSGGNLIHFSKFTHFASLCLLVLSLYVLAEDA